MNTKATTAANFLRYLAKGRDNLDSPALDMAASVIIEQAQEIERLRDDLQRIRDLPI